MVTIDLSNRNVSLYHPDYNCRLFTCLYYLQEARAYAEENGLFFMETSAKTAANVNDIFHEIGMHTFVFGSFRN